jgi:hypothetical protein
MNAFIYERTPAFPDDPESFEDDKKQVVRILRRLRDTAYETDNLVEFRTLGKLYNITKHSDEEEFASIADEVARGQRP